MALFPLQGAFDGDFLFMLIPVDDGDTIGQVAEKVAYHAVGRRVVAQDKPYWVRINDKPVALDETITSAGVSPMSLVQVGYQS